MPVNIARVCRNICKANRRASLYCGRDDGPGIPLSKREVIFDRGQRLILYALGKV